MFFLLAAKNNSGSGVVTGITPSKSTIVGVSQLWTLIGGVADIALLAAVAGILFSAALMAIGHHSGNGQTADKGRKGLLAAIVATVVIGGAAAIINFAFNTGSSFHGNVGLLFISNLHGGLRF